MHWEDVVLDTGSTKLDLSKSSQGSMSNSAFQAGNALSSLRVTGTVPSGPVLLVDTLVVSGWTMTVGAVLLAEHGAGPVLPLALLATSAS
jgi:ATP-dependent DNA helicase RecQ